MSGLTVKADNKTSREGERERNKDLERGTKRRDKGNIRQWRIYDQIGGGVTLGRNKRKDS